MTQSVVLATVGSLGDLHPFIAVARALRDFGVDVLIAAAPEYRDKAEAAGIAFHAMRPGFEDMQRDLGLTRQELVQAAMTRSDFLFRRMILPYVEASYEDVMACTTHADLMLTSSLAFGARLAAQKRAIPWLAVVLQPMMFLSAYDPPAVPHLPGLRPLFRLLGPTATRPALRLLRAAVDTLFGPLSLLRAKIGLPPDACSPLFEGQFSAPGAIGLYSALLGEPQPDYPPATAVVGFAAFDSEDGAAPRLDPALENFLAAGAAPIVFTLGSVVVNSPGGFNHAAVEAARALGRRAVLLAGESAAQFAHLGSSQVHVCRYAPHSLLLPRAAAVVHHGGIGTLAQALRAGRPQLIIPHFADQMDNAARAARIGVARVLAPTRFHGAAARRELRHVLGDTAYAARSADAARRLSAENGAAGAATVVLDTLGRLRRQ